MKQNLKKWLLLIAGVFALIAVGCGITGCSDSGGGTGNNTVVTPTPPTVEPETPVTAPSDPNGEGVRDDVRAYVEATYPHSAKTRAALFQYAKVMEKALADANDKELSIQHAEEDERAGACLWYTFGSVDTYGKAEDDLRPIILNTDERNMAYFKYNNQLGGEVFKGIPYGQRASACDIDPSTLSN